MKTLKKIAVTLVILFCFVFAATYIFLFLQGKSLIIRQLEGLTQKKVDIGYVGLTLPFNLEIRNLNIEGLAKADYISALADIPALLTGKIVLSELKIIRPEINYEKRPAQAARMPKPSAVFIPVVLTVTKPAGKQPLPLAFKHLVIKEGKINFRDYSVGGEGIIIKIKELDLDMTDLYLYPHPAKADFTLKAKIPWLEGEVEGKVEAEGWVDLLKRDMQATLKITDIDGVYLYPYYAQWVDLEETRLEKAKLNVTSDIKSVDGNITAPCHLELRDIVFKKPGVTEGESEAQKIIGTVMDVLSAISRSNKIVFNFTYKGKMPAFY